MDILIIFRVFFSLFGKVEQYIVLCICHFSFSRISLKETPNRGISVPRDKSIDIFSIYYQIPFYRYLAVYFCQQYILMISRIENAFFTGQNTHQTTFTGILNKPVVFSGSIDIFDKKSYFQRGLI